MNNKFKFTLISILLSIYSYALPSLGVANIFISQTINTPTIMGIDKPNDSATYNQVTRQMSNFSAQVKGQIIQSNRFKIVDIDNNLASFYLNLSLASESSSESKPNITKTQLPEYVLVGKLSSINAGTEINPINDTSKYSNMYSIDIAVDYQLIRTIDNTIVAAFTAAGHSGNIKIVNSMEQKVVHNTAQLIKQVGDDLATEVNTALNQQIGGGKLYLNNPESMTKITDFKTYDN